MSITSLIFSLDEATETKGRGRKRTNAKKNEAVAADEAAKEGNASVAETRVHEVARDPIHPRSVASDVPSQEEQQVSQSCLVEEHASKSYKDTAKRVKGSRGKRAQPVAGLVGGALESKNDAGASDPVTVAKHAPANAKRANEILGAAVKMTKVVDEEVIPKSSYAFETSVPEVAGPQRLKTYRVQVDYGKRDKMIQGYVKQYMPLLACTTGAEGDRPSIYAMLPLLTQGTTAPQMPPPKINDPNMQFNWSHLIDQWPLKSKRPCSNCMHPFDSIPWFIPVKRIESYYKMDDSEHVFCSYPCQKRFLLSSGYPDRFMYLVYLNDIARNYFGWKGELLAAPQRIWLETMSIEEFRSYLCPPLMYSFARRGEHFDPSHEARWMSDMTVLRPPFLSGAAIMEWVANNVPRAYQATKVLYDVSRPQTEAVSAALLMGSLDDDGSMLNKDTLKRVAARGLESRPWRVEGLRVPSAKEIQEMDANRIVMPPIDPDAPALIDEVARMRADVARGKQAELSVDAQRASYGQQLEGLIKSKQGKKQASVEAILTGMVSETVGLGNKSKKTRKRVREEEDEE